MLNKNTILFERDEKGELIAQEVEVVIDEDDEVQLEFKGEKIMVIPMPRGKVKKIFSELSTMKTAADRDLDAEIMSEHCISPKLTLAEAKMIKPPFNTIIVDTIFKVSGVDNNKKKSRKENIEVAEDDFAKN